MSTLEDRYGTRRRPRWFWPAVAAVGVLVGIAWAAWVAFQDRPVTAEVYGYEVTSPTETVATLEVRRPDPVAVRCSVYAQAVDHAVVGERTVDLEPGTQQRVRVEVPIVTEREAVTAVLRSCRTID